MAEEVFRVEHVSKRFGPVSALNDINLHLNQGEVLGLLGDNGAGKSTLMKIICGFDKPDEGRMLLRGDPYEPRSVEEARTLGIDAVYQDLALIDQLTVFQNMFLHRERVRHPLPLVANRRMRAETKAALDEIGIHIPDINAPVARLSGGQPGDRGRPHGQLRRRHHPTRRAARRDGRARGRADPRPHGSPQGDGSRLDHHRAAQLRPGLLDLRSREPDPGGTIAFDKPTSETSVEELTQLVVDQYRRARQAAA